MLQNFHAKQGKLWIDSQHNLDKGFKSLEFAADQVGNPLPVIGDNNDAVGKIRDITGADCLLNALLTGSLLPDLGFGQGDRFVFQHGAI